MLLMLVLLLMLLLLLLQWPGWLQQVVADLPIGRTAKNLMLASVVATKLLGLLIELLDCCVRSSGT